MANVPLSDTIVSNQTDLKLKVSEEKREKYLQVFIKNHIHQRPHENLEEDLKYKVQVLDAAKTKKARYNRKPQKRKTLTVKERRSLALFKIQSDHQKYDLHLPLHELWKSYIRTLIRSDRLSESGLPNAEESLLKADYHGAELSVTQSANPALVGLSGIVLQETKNTFTIITKADKLKVLPKENTIFTTDIDGFKLTIYGNQFQYRASERAGRKFKTKATIDL